MAVTMTEELKEAFRRGFSAGWRETWSPFVALLGAARQAREDFRTLKATGQSKSSRQVLAFLLRAGGRVLVSPLFGLYRAVRQTWRESLDRLPR